MGSVKVQIFYLTAKTITRTVAEKTIIRTEDRGIVLLIDDRFSRSSYKKLFPEEWKKVRYAVDVKDICKAIEDFWAEPGSKGS